MLKPLKEKKSYSGEETNKIEAKDKPMRLSEEKKATVMGEMVAKMKNPPIVGDMVEGPVMAVEKSSVFIDMAPFGTGIIYGREFLSARDIIKKINIGDIIAAKIVDNTHKEGYYELSLKEARQALIWSEAEAAIKEKKSLDLPVKEANKGGLLIEWQGITGFLPASQLKPEHYPKIADGDKDRILDELKKLVGTRLGVSIITADPKEGKLIFSEKGSEIKEKEKIISKYEIGDEVEGTVTGVVDFGAFVKVEEGLEGLVHISEIDWGLVDNPNNFVKVGQKIRARIIEVKDGKISLSIKQLKPNPWIEAAKKYKKDMSVTGVIIKFNKHGALASVEEGVAGLVHISEFGNEEKLHKMLELGKTYDFKISLFDPKEQKMALSFAGTK
ncbi:S1 RNA-binding domain-containing protein [Patescibacteria group bacterium]|nr:S1 RNA-binding domain-containing protein [Patescibacteria group bacterium]MDE1946324.1 S1 RNA-binding domain-containing protein [Patescibacteria group bacterium]MDE2010776.1 S1 RNA-binding domain-containing protein [Patescibacteria group bacterium]MDE2232661.1 S1 RNA-binding domain-containing protein [Patescibacteria group bacterium]